MPERRVTVASASGLHARPAALFCQAAAAGPVPVRISKGDVTVDAASILGVMRLGVKQGDEVVLAAEGADADHALDELGALLERDLDTTAA
ncbi:HPr family phosphocarrier protein [Streptomyces sp. SAI-229]|jgi:phosphocarrier protein|uniref:HPr family phosphocarrier protein n=1 Tax=Streptomyces sp. SAI-229 TaxID=3377731 RepID=UPI003C7E7DDF